MRSASQPDSGVLARFVVGFAGTRLPVALQRMLARGLAGVALYPRNWTTLEELCALTAEIRAAARGPVLVAADQEGGTPFSLPEPFTSWPSPAELGRADAPELLEAMAQAMARELLAAGVNLNFAPMLDLHLNPESPLTRQRSFGADPSRVGRLGAAFLRGLEREGVLGCAKHFPGHGDAAVDPHEDLPVFHGDAGRLEEVELVPFRDAIAAGAPMVMTAHILLPRIDAEHPASLSRAALHAILRAKMGFAGVILIDDLGMAAIRRRYPPGEAAVRAIRAGTDLVAICHDASAAEPAMRAVAAARAAGELEEGEWGESQRRIEALLARAAQAGRPAGVVGCEAHRALAAALRERIGGAAPAGGRG